MSSPPKLPSDGIEVELLEDKEVKAVLNSANEVLRKVFPPDGHHDRIEFMPENFWPSITGKRPEPRLVLLPLDRVGSEPGFSGTRVLISYFKDARPRKRGPVFPSLPLVVKIRAVDGPVAKCILKDEDNRARRISDFVKYEREAFAWPLYIGLGKHTKEYSVLWSSFVSRTTVIDLKDPSRLTPTQMGLYTLLAGEMAPSLSGRTSFHSDNIESTVEDVLQLIDRVFECLKPLHWHGKRAPSLSKKPKNLVDIYSDYLRGFRTHGGWGNRWRAIWGTEDDKFIKQMKPKKIYNPIFVLKALESVNRPVTIGAVHGDLHPRNIVLTRERSPRIIDFGWARKSTHIAKDFALMECNLRFMVLRPDIPAKSLSALVSWIPFDGHFHCTKDEYVNAMARLIDKLHQIAKSHFPTGTDWTAEYIVPVFLVALGLLKPKTFSSCHNREAAQLTILNLANFIGKKLADGDLA